MNEEILNNIIAEYTNFINTPKIKSFWELIKNGSATYKDARDFSKVIADKMSEILVKHMGVNADVSQIDIDSLLETINKSLVETYNTAARYSASVQRMLNQEVGINVNPIKPKIKQDRIDNLLEKLLNGEDIDLNGLINESTEWLIGKDVVENIANSAVLDTINDNAELLSNAGFQTVMTRHEGPGGCCDWCRSVAGTYTKGTEPSDFWKVHKNCNCWIEYKPAKKATSYIRYTSRNGKRVKITS